MTSPDTLTVGSTFHAWTLDRVLARGGSGTVYAATHRLTNRPAAVKVITPARSSVANAETIARFRVELQLHLELRLANVPEFYDADLTPDGAAVLVLELLDGADLARLLSHAGPLSTTDALFVTSELLRTLPWLHRVGVHRDIKPSNVFVRRRARLDSEGRVEKRRVTLLDFGIAKVKERPGVTMQNTIVGTPCYMSPEQLRGQPIDPRTDLYSTGALLYEMLSGRPPYVADPRKLPSAGELILAHESASLLDLREVVPDLAEEVWAFLRTLLAKQPGERYPTAESAFAVATALLARCSGGARRFREEIDGGTSEPLPPAAPTIVDEPIDFDDEAPPTEAMPAMTIVANVRTEAAPNLETERLDPEGDPLDPWEERQLASARRLLRGPRVFRSPAVASVDPASGAILGLRPLQAIESRIGSGPDAVVRVLEPGVMPHHATLR
jgi:serine/threonine-protein kinase